jgi:hypothetical protein
VESYIVRLTVEGESCERTELADDSLHAIRQALAMWCRLAPEDGAVITARRVATLHSFERAAIEQQHRDELAAPERIYADGSGITEVYAGGGEITWGWGAIG